jgi:myosin heavy subunit
MSHKFGKRLLRSRSVRATSGGSIFWTILSALSQVGLLGLAMFGYFYTIRPVYQNQLLTEQKASLELEAQKLQGKNDTLSKSIELKASQISRLSDQIESLTREKAATESRYKSAILETSRVQKNLEDVRKERQALDSNIEQTKIAYILESFESYIFARAAAKIATEATSLSVVEAKDASSMEDQLKAFLGDPYSESKNLIEDYFSETNVLFRATGIDPKDPLRFRIHDWFLTDLEKVKQTISISDEVVTECKKILIDYSAKRKTNDAERNKLHLKDFKSFSEYEARSSQLLSDLFALRDDTMKRLDELKKGQYDIFGVLQLLLSNMAKQGILPAS